jgi:N-acetylglutamate synthase-like GNAT family acetyltransferase
VDPHVRRAIAEDAPMLADLVERSYQHYVPRIGLRPMPMDADYADVVLSKMVWVAELDHEVAGLVVISLEPDRVLIDNLAVSPDFQGHGIGSRLLTLAEDTARSAGVAEVRLFTHELMVENIRYYVSRGYDETHRQQENGFSRVFFSKRLT